MWLQFRILERKKADWPADLGLQNISVTLMPK